ncbi:MAG: hypothetical protein ACQESR_15540 [Planctomycetota bacterium]
MSHAAWTVDNVLIRDPSVLAPVEPVYVWEFIRRHPHYIAHWQEAKQYREAHRNDQWEALDKATQQQLSSVWDRLNNLGAVGSDFPDPSIDGRNTPGFVPPFTSAAARILTYRLCLTIALMQLPHCVREKVANSYLNELVTQTVLDQRQQQLKAEAQEVLANVPSEKKGDLFSLADNVPLSTRLISELSRLDMPELDQALPDVLYIDVYAPLDDIIADVKAHVQRCREHGNIPDRRRRGDKYDDYLRVWDLREGFCEGAYHGDRELRLAKVSQELGIPKATVQSHHKAAFQLITGHTYDPDLWLILFQAWKPNSKFSSWRKNKSRSSSVPQKATVQTHTTGPAATASDDQDLVDLALDIKTLCEQGKPEDRIAAQLEIPIECVEDARKWIEDGLFEQ